MLKNTQSTIENEPIFVSQIRNNTMFTKCGHFWIYLKYHLLEYEAKSSVETLPKINGIQYLLLQINDIVNKESFYVVILGEKESIKQLTERNLNTSSTSYQIKMIKA